MAKPPGREDPRDANPFFKTLPSEVTVRSKVVNKSGPTQAAAASLELEQVMQRKPEGRAKWLVKALQQCQEGKVQAQGLYDILTSQRFCDDLTEKVGNKMYRAMHAHMQVFSLKQRKFLEKESRLAKLFAKTAFIHNQKDGDDEPEKATTKVGLLEDMMARCREFVREKQQERGERRDGEAHPEDAVEAAAGGAGATFAEAAAAGAGAESPAAPAAAAPAAEPAAEPAAAPVAAAAVRIMAEARARRSASAGSGGSRKRRRASSGSERSARQAKQPRAKSSKKRGRSSSSSSSRGRGRGRPEKKLEKRRKDRSRSSSRSRRRRR